MLDLPTCGAGNGDNVAFTFSVMRGPSLGLSVEAMESLWSGWPSEGSKDRDVFGSADF